MNAFSVSLAQINIRLGQPEQNLLRAQEMVASAAQSGSQLILFPELWTTGYDLAEGPRHARANLELLAEIKVLAAESRVSIGGSYLLAGPGGVYNTYVLISPNGEEIRYSKIHLFRLMDEHIHLQAGEASQLAAFPWGQAGLAICYDLRFPELFRKYALAGALATFMVAEWPARRIFHWQTLLRGRAIENQMFFGAVNAVGRTGDETFGGRSALIDPWGETICEAGAEEEALIAGAIDPAAVERIRQTIPVFSDRRPDLY